MCYNINYLENMSCSCDNYPTLEDLGIFISEDDSIWKLEIPAPGVKKGQTFAKFDKNELTGFQQLKLTIEGNKFMEEIELLYDFDFEVDKKNTLLSLEDGVVTLSIIKPIVFYFGIRIS